MSIRLVVRNLRKNMQAYLIYFMTLALSIAIFYAFNSVTSTEALKSLGPVMSTLTDALGSTIHVLSKVIAVLLGFLIVYVNRFLLKRRKRELGIYMLLGMKKQWISAVLVGETFLIGLVSLVVGIVTGIFLGQLLTLVALRAFGGMVDNFSFSFCPEALTLTITCFGIIYVLMMILNMFSISNVRLIDLLTAERKNEEIKHRGNVIYAAAFVLGLFALAAGVLSLRTQDLMPDIIKMVQGIVLIMVATILLFFSVFAVFLMLAKKKRTFYYNNINSFLIRQIGSRIQSNFITMSLECLMLTATILIIVTGSSITVTMTGMADTYAPYDFVVYYDCQEDDCSVIEAIKNYQYGQDIEPLLKDSYQFIEKTDSRLTYSDIFGADMPLRLHDEELGLLEQHVKIISISDFNALLALQGKPQLALSENEFYMNCNDKGTFSYADAFLKQCSNITLNGTTLYPAERNLLEETYEMTYIGDNDHGTFIVPDAVAEHEVILRYVLQGNWKPHTKHTEDILNELYVNEPQRSPFAYTTRPFMRVQYYSTLGFPVFLCSYTGLIFLLISVALIAVQQLTEVSDNKKRFQILQKQGVSDSMLQSTVRKQVGIYFLAPLLFSCSLHPIFMRIIVWKLSTFCNMEIRTHLLPTLVVLLVIYGGYYVATVTSCIKIIFEKKKH